MEKRILRILRDEFTQVKTYLFRNPVTFPNPQELIEYWKSYYLYDKEYEQRFIREVKNHFELHRIFTTVKEVIGIIAKS